jgi:hypothetical protein
MQDMVKDLQQRTQQGLQRTGQVFNERVSVVRAGTKLLTDGAVTAVLAKKAALDAARLDAEFLSHAQTATAALQQSAALLRDAQSKPVTVDAIDSALSLANLAEEHAERAEVYVDVFEGLTQQPASTLEMSAPEWDALRLAQLGQTCKEAAQAAAETTKAAAAHISKSMAFAACSRVASAASQCTASKNGKTRITAGASYGRVDTIRAGTNLLSDRGTTAVLAKKAALDAARLDAKVLLGALETSVAFRRSAAGLRAAESQSESGASLARLAEEHEARAEAYDEALEILRRQPATAPELGDREWEALRLA